MATPTESYIVANGIRHWTVTQGSGVPVILCHGGPGIYDYLEPVAHMIDDIALVHRYDQRGCGRSGPATSYTVANHVADLDALRAAWGHEKVIVAGHSWGANLALAYSLAHPDRVSGLMYLAGYRSGVGSPDACRLAYDRACEAKMTPHELERELYLNERRKVATGEELEAIHRERKEINDKTNLFDPKGPFKFPATDAFPINYEANALGGTSHKTVYSPEWMEGLLRLNVPALVLHPAGDPRPRWDSEALARIIRAKFVVLEKAGHDPWIEQPEALRAALREFLTSIT